MMLQESMKKGWYILSELNVSFRIIVLYLKECEQKPLGGGTLLILGWVHVCAAGNQELLANGKPFSCIV